MSEYALDLPDDFDIHELARTNPEKAAILLDYSIKNQVASERESWIIRARMIYYLKETDLWRHHPEGFKSFFEYCGQPDIDIAPSVASDMLALVKHAPHLEAAGVDIWDVIRRAGHSKVRQIIPQIREAHRAGVLKEQIVPIVEAIDAMTFREVLDLTATSGVRSSYDLAAIYQETADGEISVVFKDLDIDDLEYLYKKVGIKRWYDPTGKRIDPPLDDMNPKALKAGV